VQLGLAGTLNVHQLEYPDVGFRLPARPENDCAPWGAVWSPSEKLDPSGPGSLTAEPDCPRCLELSHTEIVNERAVSIAVPSLTAACPGAVIDSAEPLGPRVHPAPPWRESG
jgi:hypothetical protein